ncbi:MAG: DUF5107 domain-containing protein [Clostridia bacterium]|nr:DUF5107 domain-containing protein [Clostridia bacterium]
MATTLEFIKFNMPCQDMNGTSTLPGLQKLGFWHRNGDSGLGEDDELFIGYGHVPSCYPYKMQDMYSRELKDKEMNGVVLENEYLKAVFLPEWGGKMMSLFDKVAGKDLLYTNPVMRPCNLAARNAWTSGGIEWNCGMFGHHVHTCDTMYTTTTELSDGTPVLRMYEFHRIRRVVQQMDFFLPQGSKVLFARNRIINPLPDVVPMYWWTNIAAPETPDTRIVVNADGAYVADDNTSLAPIPEYRGDDVTYPINVPAAGDYFYKILPKQRKFEACLDADGYGLIYASTYRLKGRKLFCWGQNPGGDRWQEYLTTDGSPDRYVELQGGICHTQYECMPMPPHTTWEWLEAFGAMNADGDTVHGEWQGAKAEVAKRLDEIITDDRMDEILEETKAMAKSAATGELKFRGSGWGALENLLREKNGKPKMAPHLDFGTLSEEHADWTSLMNEGKFLSHDAEDSPISWMLQPEWIRLMESACESTDKDNWYAHLQLGMAYIADGRLNDGWMVLEKSEELKPSAWAQYGRSVVKRCIGDLENASLHLINAANMLPHDISIAKEAMEVLIAAGKDNEAIELYEKMPAEVRAIGRVRLYATMAHIHLGHIEEAESVLNENGGLILPDIREGETIITELWFLIEEAKAKRDGREFDRNTATVPPIFDYRQCSTKHRRPARKRAK